MHYPENSILLGATQAATMLGVSERKFHELRRAPDFPAAVVIGVRCVRWVRDELVEYAKSLPRVNVLPEPRHLRRIVP